MTESDEIIALALRFAKPDWTVKQLKEFANQLLKSYNFGVYAAAEKAREWGDEANATKTGAGSGYHNLADAIVTLVKTIPE